MQRPSPDTPSPRALPRLLGCSEPGTLCSECCAPCLLGTRKASSLQAQSAAEAAFGEAGRGSKTGPTWGSRALPTPPGREGKPRQKDLAPPLGGRPSFRALAAPSPLYTSAPLLKTRGNHACALCPPGAREAAAGGFLALGEALDGGAGGQRRAHSASRCSLGVQAAPRPSARSPRVNPAPHPHSGRPWLALASCFSPRASLVGVGPAGPSLLSPSIYSRVPARAWRRAVA